MRGAKVLSTNNCVKRKFLNRAKVVLFFTEIAVLFGIGGEVSAQGMPPPPPQEPPPDYISKFQDWFGDLNWIFHIDGLNTGSLVKIESLTDWIQGILAMLIAILTVVGVVYGVQIVMIKWIYYADRYNEEKLKEVKQRAMYIVLGWLALVIGFVLLYMYESKLQSGLL